MLVEESPSSTRWRIAMRLTRPCGLLLLLALPGRHAESLASDEPSRTAPSGGTPSPIANKIGMKLVLIPAGEFRMGSGDDDAQAEADEKPRHRVRITRPFYLGATEVTQGQYQAVTGQNPSFFRGSSDAPVERVSWNEAVAFCNKLSEREGLKPRDPTGEDPKSEGEGYRLPTEAEWEYACRAGTSTRYSFGDDAAKLGDFGWFGRNSRNSTHDVGRKRPNAWGLYDMYGNVWEWCGDGYDASYYGKSPAADPSGPPQAERRVNRGGAWSSPPARIQTAYRRGGAPGFRGFSLGFRVARGRGDL
jgi:formylglycine-generating enzyme required for sulfatase activity